MVEHPTLLILGGTREAADLAARLASRADLRVVSSLAGRTLCPAPSAGEQRRGGFGGAAGLADYLREERVTMVVDATHPFADAITANAAAACEACRIPRLRLLRPAWTPMARDRWIDAADVTDAAARLDELGERIFLAIGRQDLAAFAALPQHWFLVRTVDPLETPLPLARHEAITGRGPFTLPDEMALLRHHGIAGMVSRNAGGGGSYAKIAAARNLDLPVIMIRRPVEPPGEQVASVAAAEDWVGRRR